jgi:hypothetical protein
MPSAQFENEAMNCGERRTASGVRRFALIGVDSVPARPADRPPANVVYAIDLVRGLDASRVDLPR